MYFYRFNKTKQIMEAIKLNLDNLDKAFPVNFTQEQIAKAKTLFLKKYRSIEQAH